MALGTPIDRSAIRRNGGTGTISTGSFTPSSDSLLIVAVEINANDGTEIPDSLVGHDGGSSWIQLDSTLSITAASVRSHSLWGCFTGASPSSDTVDIALSVSSPMGANVVEITGADVSGTVANAFTEIVGNTGYGTALSATLTGSPTDLTCGFFAVAALGAITVENTEINSIAFQYGDNAVHCDYNASGDATATATISSNRNWGAFAVDIKEAGGGGGGGSILPKPFKQTSIFRHLITR